VFSLAGLLGQKGQMWRHQRPFLIRDIEEVRFASRDHPVTSATTSIQVHNSL